MKAGSAPAAARAGRSSNAGGRIRLASSVRTDGERRIGAVEAFGGLLLAAFLAAGLRGFWIPGPVPAAPDAQLESGGRSLRLRVWPDGPRGDCLTVRLDEVTVGPTAEAEAPLFRYSTREERKSLRP